MLEYHRIDVSEGIDVNKANGLLECIICHFWYNLDINFRFQLNACDACQELTQKAMIFNNATVVSVKGNHYRIHFLYKNKDEVINLLRNGDLIENVFKGKS